MRAQRRQVEEAAALSNIAKAAAAARRARLAATSSSGGGGGGLAAEGSATVLVSEFSLTPNSVSVWRGSCVTWTVAAARGDLAEENPPHAIAVVGPDGQAAGQSGELRAGDSFTVKFDTVGCFEAYCLNYSFMAGTVFVSEAPLSAAASPVSCLRAVPSKAGVGPAAASGALELKRQPWQQRQRQEQYEPSDGATPLVELDTNLAADSELEQRTESRQKSRQKKKNKKKQRGSKKRGKQRRQHQSADTAECEPRLVSGQDDAFHAAALSQLKEFQRDLGAKDDAPEVELQPGSRDDAHVSATNDAGRETRAMVNDEQLLDRAVEKMRALELLARNADEALLQRQCTTHVVTITEGFKLVPRTVVIAPVDAVKWVVAPDCDSGFSLTSLDAESNPSDEWSSGSALLGPGSTFRRSFTQLGSFPYGCCIYPFVKGTVKVTEAPDSRSEQAFHAGQVDGWVQATSKRMRKTQARQQQQQQQQQQQLQIQQQPQIQQKQQQPEQLPHEVKRMRQSKSDGSAKEKAKSFKLRQEQARHLGRHDEHLWEHHRSVRSPSPPERAFDGQGAIEFLCSRWERAEVAERKLHGESAAK